MNPIERVRARATARELLGVGKSADAGELRAAWRRAAMRLHPDRNGGQSEVFSRVKDAYDLLSKGEVSDDLLRAFLDEAAPRAAAPAEPSSLRKPKVAVRLLRLPPELEVECRALLRGGPRARADTGDHVPVAVAVQGRGLTYHIATPLVRGTNRLSLPTAVPPGRAMSKPELLVFRSPTSGGGDIVAPDEVRQRLFPGARSVTFHFRAA